MDAKAIAQEVAELYLSQLDPFRPHSWNVRENLHKPVLKLTNRVLHGPEEADDLSSTYCTLEDETKACSDAGGGDEEKKSAVESAGTNTNERSRDKSKKDYPALRRRDKARLDAFLNGIELAVTSAAERSPPSSPSSHPKKAVLEVPKAPKTQAAKKREPAVPGKTMPKQKQFGSNPQSPTSSRNHIIKKRVTVRQPKKQFESSPVLTSLNNHGKALLRHVSDVNSVRKQEQIRERELRIRLELYIRSLCRVRSLQQICVVEYEPDRAIKARADIIVSAFVATVGCVRSMSPVLTKLLTSLTKELIAVEFIGEELFRVIRRIVSEYEHALSFASLAFLSSPEASAETRLTPMVLKYIRYLQSDWKAHERSCTLERMLANSLDGDMRRYFKTAEFGSIGHLLEVCQGFRNELQSIELTPTSGVGQSDLCNNPEAVRQATRDLQREVITINGQVQPVVGSRKELVNLLSQSLNSRSLTACPEKKKASEAFGKSESCPSLVSIHQKKNQDGKLDNEDNVSSLEEGEDAPTKRENKKGERQSKNRRASFHLSTVDLLTRRLLIAASRTGTGGDAYFIVRDLFGGEEVEVVPAKILPHHVRASRVGSIEIQVRLSCVTIKCHGSFDIYPKSLVGCCEPLIQLHTTSSETIYLRELRSCDSSSDDGKHCLEDDGSLGSDGMKKLVLQERQTNTTGRRVLSIRPALYEKVQVWNTPS